MAKEPLLTKEQVDALYEFSAGLVMGEQNGAWSPFMQNALMQGLNNNSRFATLDKVRKALADYRNSAGTLQSYMEFAEKIDMVFARTLQSYVNSLAFDLQITCSNAYTKEDYLSKEYQDDKRRIDDFLTKFDYKGEFTKIVKQLMLHEAYFVSFRKTKWNNKGMKYALQIMPQNRCIIDGYWEKGLLYSFDMSYFLQAGTDISLYDPSMLKTYNRVFGENAKTVNYNPAAQLNNRNGVYAMYAQMSPNDGYFCFKRDMSNFNTTPYLAPLIKSALSDDEVQQLQYNKDMAEAYAILAGEIAVFDSAKSGTKSDQMVFSPKTLGQFMGKVKAGMGTLPVKPVAMPVQNLKWYQYKNDNVDMYDTQMSTSAATGTGASRTIYASDRMSNAEIEAAQNETYQTMRQLYAQFNNFMTFYGNQLTKKYKFRFSFDGSTYNWERKTRIENLTKLADKGVVLNKSAWASVLGMNPVDFGRSLEESKHSDWIKQYSQMMLNVNTANSGDTGRPRQDSATLTDSGEASRESYE